MQFLTHIDLNKNELQNAVVQNLAAAPSNPKVGQIYYNTADQMTYQYKQTGSNPDTFAWKAIGGVAAGDGLTNTDDTLSVTPGNGIELSGTSPNKAVAVKAYDGIKVDSNGVSADIDTTKGLEFTGSTAGSKKIGIKVDSTLEFNNGTLKVKVPTDNNFTTGLKEKLEDIEAGAEVNTIETVKVNGTALTPDANRAVDIPTIHTATFADDSTNTAASPVKLTLTEGTDNDTITANIPKVSSTSAGVLPKVTDNTSSTKIVSADYVWDATQGDYRQLPAGAFKTGTVTSITIYGTSPISVSNSGTAITSSGNRTISHEDSGVTPGTYPKVKVDAKGHVTEGYSLSASDLPDTYLSTSGGTMSGAINMGNKKITSLGAPTADTDAATKKYVDDAITALPEPMIFKGTLGTGGTITTLPTAAASNEGWTYKVITAGTYNSQAAKVGDLFICRNVSGSLYEWTYVPSGDEPSGTVTSVGVSSPLTTNINNGDPIVSSGTISLKDAYGDTKNPYGSKTANYVLAAPNGSNGVPSFRALAAGDVPDLSGTYVTLTGDQIITGEKTFQDVPIILQYNEDQGDISIQANYTISATTNGLQLGGPVGNEIVLSGIDYPYNEYEAANRGYVDVAIGNLDEVYKPLQTAKSSPSASGNATAFIDTISQDANGVITATKKNVDFSAYVKKDGTVAMTGALNLNTHKITGVDTPTAGTDATNKTYVDSAISTAIAEVTGGAVKRRKAENPALTASGGAFTWSISTGSASTNSPGPDTMVTVYEKGSTTNVQVMPEIAINSSGAITITINDTEGLGTLAAGTYIAVMIGC